MLADLTGGSKSNFTVDECLSGYTFNDDLFTTKCDCRSCITKSVIIETLLHLFYAVPGDRLTDPFLLVTLN